MTYRIEPGSIVLAVDGSEHAERATQWAADQAFLEGRRLVVMSAASTGGILDTARPIPRTHLDPVEDGMEDAGAIAEAASHSQLGYIRGSRSKHCQPSAIHVRF